MKRRSERQPANLWAGLGGLCGDAVRAVCGNRAPTSEDDLLIEEEIHRLSAEYGWEFRGPIHVRLDGTLEGGRYMVIRAAPRPLVAYPGADDVSGCVCALAGREPRKLPLYGIIADGGGFPLALFGIAPATNES